KTQPQLLLLQKTMVMVEGLALHLDPEINMWEVSPPIVKAWMESNMGPDARLREGVEAAMELARYLPLMAEEAEKRVDVITEDGIKLHPETAREVAKAQAHDRRPERWLLAAITVLLAIIALELAF
ncbi:MAG: hypothetical protein R3360_02920, partial [Alphaproteobacteria bacterium]|nr:hypothetical protein [Alphaproteobacteria bacterium]